MSGSGVESTANKPEEQLVQAKEVGDAIISDDKDDESPQESEVYNAKIESVVDPLTKEKSFSDDDCPMSMAALPPWDPSEHSVASSFETYLDENNIFVIKKERDVKSNGKEDELTIHKLSANCGQCWLLISEDSDVFNAQCECTRISLIHKDCKDAWFQIKGDTCSNCLKQIEYTKVIVSLKTTGEKPHQMPISTNHGSLLKFWKKRKN